MAGADHALSSPPLPPSPFQKETWSRNDNSSTPTNPGANINQPVGSNPLVAWSITAKPASSEPNSTAPSPNPITPTIPTASAALHYKSVPNPTVSRKPELLCFYEEVAKTLSAAQILPLLSEAAPGKVSPAMEQLRPDLRHNHHDLSACVVGALTIDACHTTDDQLPR